MKLMASSLLIVLFSISALGNQNSTENYYCNIMGHPTLASTVMTAVQKTLKDQGYPESEFKSDTIANLIEAPQLFNIAMFGDGTESWHTDLLVVPLKKEIVDGMPLFNDRTMAFKITYTKIYTDGDDGLFYCQDTLRYAEEVIHSIQKIEKL